MNPSQVVMLLLNCSTTRNNDRRKKMQNRTQLFWQQHWIPWKASHLKRGKPPLGKEQCAYPKEEGHWKKDCPRLKSKKEKNKRRMGTSHIVEREDCSDEEWIGPETPLELRLLIPISPQEPQVTLTVGDKLTDFLLGTGATYSVVNTKMAQKTPQSIPVTGVSGQSTKVFILTNPGMPTRGPHPETQLLVYASVSNPSFGLRSPL